MVQELARSWVPEQEANESLLSTAPCVQEGLESQKLLFYT